MSDSIPSLLSLLIGAGSLWLALDFARHHSVWFAALFALLGTWPAGRGTSGRAWGALRAGVRAISKFITDEIEHEHRSVQRKEL